MLSFTKHNQYKNDGSKLNLLRSKTRFCGTHYKLQNRRSDLILNLNTTFFFVPCVQNSCYNTYIRVNLTLTLMKNPLTFNL